MFQVQPKPQYHFHWTRQIFSETMTDRSSSSSVSLLQEIRRQVALMTQPVAVRDDQVVTVLPRALYVRTVKLLVQAMTLHPTAITRPPPAVVSTQHTTLAHILRLALFLSNHSDHSSTFHYSIPTFWTLQVKSRWIIT